MSQDNDGLCVYCLKRPATCFTIFAPWSPRLHHVCQPCADKGGYKVYDSPTPLKRQGKERLLEGKEETR